MVRSVTVAEAWINWRTGLLYGESLPAITDEYVAGEIELEEFEERVLRMLRRQDGDLPLSYWQDLQARGAVDSMGRPL